MYVTEVLRTINWHRISIIFLFVVIPLVIGKQLASQSYVYLALFLFSTAILLLYLKYYEFFILLMLVINHDFFYLLPQEPLGKYRYQSLLLVVLVIIGGIYFFRNEKKNRINFGVLIIGFSLIVLMGVLNTYFHGQSLILGLKASISYYFILFYFIFLGKNINAQKLYRLVIFTGVILAFLNNIQYIWHGSINLFHYSREMERVGLLRFLIGDLFTIFSALIALGEYIKTKKKIYFLAFIYIVSTVIIQGQTRAVIFGFIITTLLMLYLSRLINWKSAILVGVPLFLVSFWFIPAIKSTFIGELWDLTRYELFERRGNVEIRLNAYNYYFREIMKSPIVGRGIWNAAFSGNNPEDMRHRGFYLSDIGITSVLFHFGLIGAIWIILLLVKVYRLSFLSFGRLKENVHYGLVGYFIFNIVTLSTLNGLVGQENIIYLALTLALISQSQRKYSEQENKESLIL